MWHKKIKNVKNQLKCGSLNQDNTKLFSLLSACFHVYYRMLKQEAAQTSRPTTTIRQLKKMMALALITKPVISQR